SRIEQLSDDALSAGQGRPRARVRRALARDYLGAATEEPMPFDLPAGARLELVPPGVRLDTMLLDGTLQAVVHPQPPPAIQGGDPRVHRLFADAPAEERKYYQRNGYWPAMHVVAFKETILREHPWVAEAFMTAFARAREIAYRYYDDPNW